MQSTTGREAVIEAARRARAALPALARRSAEEKNRALVSAAGRMEERAEAIFAANREDLARALPLVEAGEMSQALYRRLKLDDEKLRDIVAGILQVAALEDPVGKITLATELDEGLRLYRVSCPIGVIGVIFESRPDALTQIAALALKSGNAVLLKGGREAEHSNRILFDTFREASEHAGMPSDALALLESREDVEALLGAESYVDLIIPRGSNALVRHIQQNTNIPVLGHAEGICHVYVDESADIEKALDISLDAKVQYPSACNSVETILVHRSVARDFLPRAVESLKGKRVEVRCDGRAIDEFGLAGVGRATEEDWRTEYCDMVVAIRVVDSIRQAIDHINEFGSHHTDAIITEDEAAFDLFFTGVDSAGVYLNASTRFADGYRYGFGAEVGISTGKLHPRGPVGLEGLMTYKYKLVGTGQTVGLYSGPNARRFSHKEIE
ncbi:MAG TPA: glutamate-5-semialdehyde dehydrogenase [Blastocatellia bacterium]|nr:glutamate-5-semialdehyde dehydrogenase [Blastocatellia bacterium]